MEAVEIGGARGAVGVFGGGRIYFFKGEGGEKKNRKIMRMKETKSKQNMKNARSRVYRHS